MSIFKYWRKFKELLLKHEKVLWILHSVWAFTFGILVIVFFHGDFGQVKKLTLYLIALFLLLIVFDRIGAYEEKSGKRKRGVKTILNYVMKNMYQGLYFFMLPFYWEASVISSPNIIFTLIIGSLAILSTQDLIFDNWLMEKKLLRAGFYSLCLFASFDLLLPLFLPLPTSYTIVMASFLSVMAFVMLHYPKLIFKKGHVRWVILASSIVAGGCYFIKDFVPPAPYKISLTTITSNRPSKDSIPESDGVYRIHEKDLDKKIIYCAHILESPITPNDTFVHQWFLNGDTVVTKTLRRVKIAQDKYLIWSFLKHNEMGTTRISGNWTVKLLTEGGQILKKRSFIIVK